MFTTRTIEHSVTFVNSTPVPPAQSQMKYVPGKSASDGLPSTRPRMTCVNTTQRDLEILEMSEKAVFHLETALKLMKQVQLAKNAIPK